MTTLTGRQAKKIIEVFEDMPSSQVRAILESGVLADLRDGDIAKLDRIGFKKMMGLEDVIFPITLDFSLSLAQMIKLGKYDWANSNITAEHFPVQGNGQIEVNLELVHFDKSMSSKNVLKELTKKNLEPAKIEHLLAFGAKYPEEQRKYPIFALGSVWHGRFNIRKVPGFWDDSYVCSLNLYWFGFRWDRYSRFLVFPK